MPSPQAPPPSPQHAYKRSMTHPTYDSYCYLIKCTLCFSNQFAKLLSLNRQRKTIAKNVQVKIIDIKFKKLLDIITKMHL